MGERLRSAFEWLSRFAAEPADSDELRLRKVIGISIAISGISTYLIYGLIYASFGEYAAGVTTFVGATLWALGLVSYGFFRHYSAHWSFFMTISTSAMVVLTFQLGGFASSGMVIFWVLTAPLLTIVADKPRNGIYWAIVVVVVMVGVGIAEPYVPAGSKFPPAMVATLGTMNVIGLGAYMLLAVYYYVWRIEAISKMVVLERESRLQAIEKASRYKSEFLSNMSHELRTPLNAIMGFSEALDERYFGELNEKQAEYVKDIHASGRHLLSLINDILDLSKIEAGRMELEVSEFSLPGALADANTLIRERAMRHGIAIELDVDPQLDVLRADERKFKQIMLNLLSNAVKFTPDGGAIRVRACANGTMAEISVSDTGAGIAPEDQAAVFEEFKQVGRDSARKAEGTGLGLPLAKRFIELHGGAISLSSVVGQGSMFTFSLPLPPAQEIQ